MQGQIKVFRITSKKFPDKQWDSIEHFHNYHDDRQIIKNEKKYRKDSGFRYNEIGKQEIHIKRSVLLHDRKTVIKLIIADQRIHKYNHKSYDQPHIDKGILHIEELLSLDIGFDKLEAITRFLLENFEKEEWKKILQQIK